MAMSSSSNIDAPLLANQPMMASPPLWALFDKAWTAVMGYPASEFSFVQGVTPMSTLTSIVCAIVTYFLVVFGGREFMRNRPPMRLDFLLQVHNLALTIVSGALLALFLEQLVPSVWRKGLYDNICGDSGWSDQLVMLYYLNYLTKYVELIDTVFLVLRKKPLTLIHCYHHPSTAFLCLSQLTGGTSISWVPITLNLGVHVIMYWYYFQSARGVRIWWKEWITRLQIVQFVVDLVFVYFGSFTYYTATYRPELAIPGLQACRGTRSAAASGCVILSSYFVLFIRFYIQTYRKAVARKDKEKVGVEGQEEESGAKQSTVQIATGSMVHSGRPVSRW